VWVVVAVDGCDDGGGKRFVCLANAAHAAQIGVNCLVTYPRVTPRVYPYPRSRVRVYMGSDIPYPDPDPPYPYPCTPGVSKTLAQH
jgi:hypothetical protein